METALAPTHCDHRLTLKPSLVEWKRGHLQPSHTFVFTLKPSLVEWKRLIRGEPCRIPFVLEEQVLKKRCKVLGESHFRTLTTMGILARFYGPKNTKKAVELLIQMLEKERIIHEKEHLVQ